MVHRLPSVQAAVFAVNTQPLVASQVSSVHGLPSLQLLGAPASQAPSLHASPNVHTLPSLHGTVLLTEAQPVVGSQLSVVHGLASSHGATTPATQIPALQASFWVHVEPSLQGSVLVANTQPVWLLQLSLVHGLLSPQVTAAPAWQAPLSHMSPEVQALPSVHGTATLMTVQPPLGVQVSTVQALPSLHTTALPGLHLPAAQTSPLVQALPSSHGAVVLLLTQPLVVTHESAVHGLLSLQFTLPPPVHLPLTQASPLVQASLSLQAKPAFKWVQPVCGLQASTVHGWASSQFRVAPAPHLLFKHESPWVQALPSSHGPAWAAKAQPEPGLQLSAVHGLPSTQVKTAPLTHLPALHKSFWVQTLASLHGRAAFKTVQPVCGLQPSTVHGLASSQVIATPALHLPTTQVSPWLQALPSSQLPAWGWLPQPVIGSQFSVVHGLLSLQRSAAPPAHLPLAHVSF